MFRFVKKVGLPSLIIVMAVICALAPMASASKTTTPPPGVTVKVAKPKATSILIDKKFKTCFSYAEKLELPAPPRDPLAHCRGTVVVKAKASASATCKRGWLGGSAKANLNITVKVRVRAFSQAIASGRAWAVARTQIRSRISGKVVARVNCVRPPVAPQVTPTPQPQAVVSCPSGSAWNGAQCVVQTNTAEVKQSAEQACKANVHGTWNGTQCVIIQSTTIVQINATCSKVTVNLSDGTTKVTYTDGDGNTVTENYCSSTVTPKPPTPPTPPTKDGTQTPAPPSDAPGPNPSPSPDEPFPGGYKCYDETTGHPVSPRSDGTCPVGSGSFGA